MTGDVNQAHFKKLDKLPAGWAEASVNDIVKMISTNGKKLPQKKYMVKAEYPVIDQGQGFIGGYHEDESLLIDGEPPYVVFGDHSRAFKFANFKFIPGADGVKIMQPIGVEPKWAFYIFQAIKLPDKGYARHFQYLKESYLPIPPLQQQKRIVAKIEELFSHIDAGIAALNKAKQLLKQYRQSVLKAAVTGELTKHLPGRQAGWRDPLFRNKCGKLVPKNSDKYFAYVLECENGSLYKGFSKNLYMRIDQHLSGQGAKWTKEHKPVSIIHFEEFETEKEAIEREKYFKSGSGREWINEIRTENNRKFEPASQLLERILQERRQKWEAQQLEQFKAKGKVPKDDKWKAKYKEPENVNIESLPDIPEQWVWARLDSVAFVGTGMSVSKSREVINPIDVAYLRVANVQRGHLILDKVKTMRIEKEKLEQLKLQEWDVLYNEGGDIDKLGRGWIWEKQVEPCITQNHVFRASPYIKQRNHSIFLSVWGNTFGQDYFIDTGKQTTNLASINKGVLSAFPTPLPCIEEQIKVIDLVEEKLTSIERLEVEVNMQLIKAEKNKQSILASAFSGRLN
jgi:predicted GIY-YIG superfamily endonuclease